MSIETIQSTNTLERESQAASAFEPQNARFSGHPSIVRMNRYADFSSLPFMSVARDDWSVLYSADISLPIIPDSIRDRISSNSRVFELNSGLVFYSLPLEDVDERPVVALGYVLSQSNSCPQEATIAAAEMGWSQSQLNEYLEHHPQCHVSILRRLLAATYAEETPRESEIRLEAELDKLSTEIEQTYEEISLLHSLTGNLQISRSPVDLAELCLDRMTGLIPAEGNIIWLEERNRATHFLLEGSVPFDEAGLMELVGYYKDHDWTRPLVKNYMENMPLGQAFPGIRNFVIVPIAEGSFRSGWIVNYNIEEGREFGTVEASLLNSIATILGTHIRNIDLYRQHEELLVSFVRSMVSSLDAKDPYTRGHSERVALIGRRLAEQLNLSAKDQQDVYLSGYSPTTGTLLEGKESLSMLT